MGGPIDPTPYIGPIWGYLGPIRGGLGGVPGGPLGGPLGGSLGGSREPKNPHFWHIQGGTLGCDIFTAGFYGKKTFFRPDFPPAIRVRGVSGPQKGGSWAPWDPWGGRSNGRPSTTPYRSLRPKTPKKGGKSALLGRFWAIFRCGCGGKI